MHHATTSPKHLRNIKADSLTLERYKETGYPELTFATCPGPWVSVHIVSGDTTKNEMTDQEKREGEAYMLKRIRLALTWLEVMEETGIIDDEVINNHTPLKTSFPRSK